MGRINRHNYEIYFLDYLDGKLDENLLPDFRDFLNKNPDLSEELSEFESIKIEPDKPSFQNKEELKKESITDRQNNFDDLCIGYLEGDLNAAQKKEFENLINESPGNQKEFELYQKTRLVPPKINFAYKNKLKKSRPFFLSANRFSRIASAASVAILIGLFSVLNNSKISPNIYSNKLNEHISPSVIKEININNNLNNLSYLVSPNNTEVYYIEPYNLLPEVKVNSHKTRSFVFQNNAPKKLTAQKVALSEDITSITNKQVSQESIPANTIRKINSRVNNSGNFLASNLDKIKNKLNPDKKSFSLLRIADAGLEGISRITGKELDLKARYNDKGELKRLAFTSETFRFSTDVNKKKPSGKE
jgi:hypothetical protein